MGAAGMEVVVEELVEAHESPMPGREAAVDQDEGHVLDPADQAVAGKLLVEDVYIVFGGEGFEVCEGETVFR